MAPPKGNQSQKSAPHEKPSTEKDEKSDTKKDADKTATRPVKFTSNQALEVVSPPDNTVGICRYIDVAERAKTVGKDRKYTLIKFVLNNDGGKRVQCVAWQEQVERMKDLVQINKIVRLNGAVAKKIENPAYNIGNTSYELSIQEHTEVIDKGLYISAEDANSRSEPVTWDDVGNMEGRLIEIKGHLKMLFNQTKHKMGEAIYTIGAITDGKLKMAVRVTDANKLPNDLRKGCMITVVGILNFDGENPYVKVARGSDIKNVEGTLMDEDEMMEAVCMPRKKSKSDSLSGAVIGAKGEGASKILH